MLLRDLEVKLDKRDKVKNQDEVNKPDLNFDHRGEPAWIENQSVIVQDIAHRLSAAGYPTALIGAATGLAEQQQQLAELVEADLRVMPGSVQVLFNKNAVQIRAELMQSRQPVAVEI